MQARHGSGAAGGRPDRCSVTSRPRSAGRARRSGRSPSPAGWSWRSGCQRGRGRIGMTAGARCCRRAGSRSGSWPGVPLAYALSLKQRRRARPRTTRQEPCASQMTPALRHRRPRGPSRRAWRPLTSPFRARSLRRFIATLAPGLAPGISPRTATDLLWAFSNEELYRELVVERGWSPGSIRAVARPHPSRTALGRTHRHEPIGTPLIRCSAIELMVTSSMYIARVSLSSGD